LDLWIRRKRGKGKGKGTNSRKENAKGGRGWEKKNRMHFFLLRRSYLSFL